MYMHVGMYIILLVCFTEDTMTDITGESSSQPEASGSKPGDNNHLTDVGRTSAMSSQSSGSSGSQVTQASSQASSQQTQPLSQFRGSKMSNRIRAYAFITLGEK